MKTLCFDYKFDFLKKGWLSWHPWILNSKVLVRNQIIFIWGWLLTALSRVEHFILKQVIDPDNSKARQRTKSLASFLNMCVCVCVCMHAQLCLTFCDPWTTAHQAPLSLEFSRQEYLSWLPFLSPGDLPNSGIKPTSLMSPALTGRFFTTEPPGNPDGILEWCNLKV